MMASPLRVGLLGCGVVGGGVVALLKRNESLIAERALRPIRITRIATRTPGRDVCLQAQKDGITVDQDLMRLCQSADVDVVVEALGGIEPARTMTLAAIAARKSVVTANKALLALHGDEISTAVRACGVRLGFEASVAAGIPIIKVIREGLSANRFQWIAGIINGTTNYILSTMRQGINLSDALAKAQKLGYAEADPTLDIDGTDAAHKLTIMAALAFDIPLSLNHVIVKGIANLDAVDVSYAEELGYRIKLLGIAKRHAGEVELRVQPTLVPKESLIANVEGAMNAVLIASDGAGPTLYYGKGAGAEPTASAIIADLIDCARGTLGQGFSPHPKALPVLDRGAVSCPAYIRLRVLDEPGVLANVARILADNHISIEAMTQHAPGQGERQVDMVMLTNAGLEKNIRAALSEASKLPAVCGTVVSLPVEELGGGIA